MKLASDTVLSTVGTDQQAATPRLHHERAEVLRAMAGGPVQMARFAAISGIGLSRTLSREFSEALRRGQNEMKEFYHRLDGFAPGRNRAKEEVRSIIYNENLDLNTKKKILFFWFCWH